MRGGWAWCGGVWVGRVGRVKEGRSMMNSYLLFSMY